MPENVVSPVHFGHKPILAADPATPKKCHSLQKWSKLTPQKVTKFEGMKIIGKHGVISNLLNNFKH